PTPEAPVNATVSPGSNERAIGPSTRPGPPWPRSSLSTGSAAGVMEDAIGQFFQVPDEISAAKLRHQRQHAGGGGFVDRPPLRNSGEKSCPQRFELGIVCGLHHRTDAFPGGRIGGEPLLGLA